MSASCLWLEDLPSEAGWEPIAFLRVQHDSSDSGQSGYVSFYAYSTYRAADGEPLERPVDGVLGMYFIDVPPDTCVDLDTVSPGVEIAATPLDVGEVHINDETAGSIGLVHNGENFDASFTTVSLDRTYDLVIGGLGEAPPAIIADAATIPGKPLVTGPPGFTSGAVVLGTSASFTLTWEPTGAPVLGFFSVDQFNRGWICELTDDGSWEVPVTQLVTNGSNSGTFGLFTEDYSFIEYDGREILVENLWSQLGLFMRF